MRNPTTKMTIKGFVAPAFALGLGLMLGSCSPFSGFVADSWPHFAGGEPQGLPPRPGQPGYAQFISHGQPDAGQPDAGQPDAGANSPAANAPPPAAGAPAVTTSQKPASTEQRPTAFTEPPPQEQKPEAPLPPDDDPSAGDSGVTRGGLY
jgi:hypothetical protein